MASRTFLPGIHTFALGGLASLSMLLASVVLAAPPAHAEVTHKFLSSITEVPASSGGSVAGPFGRVTGLAIDSGELYVADTPPTNGTEARVSTFDVSSGAFVSQLPPVSFPLEYVHQGVAVGHTAGETNVYIGGDELVEGNPRGVVAVYDPTGTLKAIWKGTETPNKAFACFECGGLPGDIAVDDSSTLGWAAGDVYAVDPQNAAVDVFSPTGGSSEKYVTQLTEAAPGEPLENPDAVAVDGPAGEILVVNRQAEVDMFRPAALTGQYEFAGKLTKTSEGALKGISGIATDASNGDIYVTIRGHVVYEFGSQGAYVGRLTGTTDEAFGAIESIAVNAATHDVYVGSNYGETGGAGVVDVFGPDIVVPDVTTAPASNPAPESATLNGTVNPDKAGAGETTCQFAWGTSESFGHVLPCAAPVAEGGSPVPVSAVLEGLEPDTTYYFRLQASNDNGTNDGEASQTLHFTTRGPGIAEESASGVSSTSATLGASIDPHGASTTYYFEYGTTSAYGADASAPPGEFVGAGEGAVEVMPRHLQGLSPDTTYHYRVVVESDLQVEPGVFRETIFDGHDQTFTTQPSGGSLTLPDGRAWELVSPVDKHGAFIVRQDFAQASKTGDGLVYETTSPTETGAPGYAEGEQVLSTHDSQGWSSQDISLPHRVSPGTTLLHGGNYRFFSEDLSLGLAEPTGEFTSLAPEVTPQDTERTLYLRHIDTCAAEPSTCYLPLVTGAPGYADVPPGTVFDPESKTDAVNNNVRFLGATPDLSHVLISTHVALTAEPIGKEALYEWSAGKSQSEELQLITGETAEREDPLPSHGGDAISRDGSRVIFETANGHLYQRDTTDGEIIQLDEVQPGASGTGSPEAILQAASSDGSVVDFTDSQKLTKGAGARGNESAKEPDLYECKVLEAGGKSKCSLTDITPETAGQRANIQDSVLGASEDASDVYFVATGVLSRQPNSEGEHAVAGAPNFYESHNGTIELVAVLSPQDGKDWASESGRFPPVLRLGTQTARVSPSGRYLAFMSDRSLTGYDNVDVSSGKPDEEVFLFDSATERIVCVSCDPSGARPEGIEIEEGVVGLDQAADIPGWSTFEPGGAEPSLYQPRYLSDSGRLFFDSSDALVPLDINKEEDVYEYEPAGVGDCQVALPLYEAAVGGCVGLISSGTAKGESTFIDASENGDDVFFLTNERLAGNDVDTALDVYDAHVCSTLAPCASAPSSPPPCTTADACRAAPSPQPAIFGAPSSATFAGAGNVKPPAAAKPKAKAKSKPKKCRKGFVKKRGKCVKAKKSAKKAGHNRRGK